MFYETGPSPSAVREQLEIVKAVAARHGGTDAVCVEGEEANKELWTIRKQCLWAAMSRFPLLFYYPIISYFV
jgi:D-lactate dehydrogenase (cytochrome)